MVLKWPRGRSWVWVALCVLVLVWCYNYQVYRLPGDRDMVREVLRQGHAWKRNYSGLLLYRDLIKKCCDPQNMFAVTKENSPIGSVLWYDGEVYHYHEVNNDTYSLFVKEPPLKPPLKGCAVVGNGGVLKNSSCGREIDSANFIIRCNLPPMSMEYKEDVGTRTHMVTANPSIIKKRFQNLQWSRKPFVNSMKVYGSSYIYMPAFTMKPGTDPSMRAYYTLADSDSKQTVLFAHPDFLGNVGRFWKERGVRAKRLSTGLFLVSLALGMCEDVTIYGFWPFSLDLNERSISHHYYDNVLPYCGFHSMPEEFMQLWDLHKSGVLRMRIGKCPVDGA